MRTLAPAIDSATEELMSHDANEVARTFLAYLRTLEAHQTEYADGHLGTENARYVNYHLALRQFNDTWNTTSKMYDWQSFAEPGLLQAITRLRP